MRSDKQKLTAEKKLAAKNQHQDPANGRHPQSAAKQGQQEKTTDHQKVPRQDVHIGHTLH